MPRKDPSKLERRTVAQMLEYTGTIEPQYMRSIPGGRVPPRKKSVPTNGHGGFMALQFFSGVKPQYMDAEPPRSTKKSHHGHAHHTPGQPSRHHPQDDYGRPRGHGGSFSRHREEPHREERAEPSHHGHAHHTPEQPSRHHPQGDHGRLRGHGGSFSRYREEPHREERAEPSPEEQEQLQRDAERRHREEWARCVQEQPIWFGRPKAPRGDQQDGLSGRPYQREPDGGHQGHASAHVHPYGNDPPREEGMAPQVPQPASAHMGHDGSGGSMGGVVMGGAAYGHQHQQPYQQHPEQPYQQQQQPQQPPPPVSVDMGHDVPGVGSEHPAPSTVGAEYGGSEFERAGPLVAYNEQGVMYQVRPVRSFDLPDPLPRQPQPQFYPQQQPQFYPEQQQQVYPEQPMLPLQQQPHGGAMVLYHPDRDMSETTLGGSTVVG